MGGKNNSVSAHDASPNDKNLEFLRANLFTIIWPRWQTVYHLAHSVQWIVCVYVRVCACLPGLIVFAQDNWNAIVAFWRWLVPVLVYSRAYVRSLTTTTTRVRWHLPRPILTEKKHNSSNLIILGINAKLWGSSFSVFKYFNVSNRKKIRHHHERASTATQYGIRAKRVSKNKVCLNSINCFELWEWRDDKNLFFYWTKSAQPCNATLLS